jgi:hypothetical protein
MVIPCKVALKFVRNTKDFVSGIELIKNIGSQGGGTPPLTFLEAQQLSKFGTKRKHRIRLFSNMRNYLTVY